MAIKYFTNRPWRAVKPVVDRIGNAPTLSAKGSQDLTVPLDETIFYTADWEIMQLSVVFDAVTSRDISFSIQNGRVVVANANDYMWIALDTTHPRKITLSEGFYTGTTLAVELKTQMDTAFSDVSVTFTIDYNATTANVYTIVPSSGTIRYDDNATSLDRSIAGHLFGLEADTTLSATLVSDTEVPSLDKKIPIVDLTASTLLYVLDDDVHCLDIDQAIVVESSTTAGLVADWEVLYREKV